MFGLLAAIITTLGATGMGSGLKIIAGIFDGWAHRDELKERSRMVRALKGAELDLEYAKAIFGADKEAQMYGRHTRRIYAIIWVCFSGVIALVGAVDPGVELLTFTLPEFKQPFELLWGFIRFPSGAEATVTLTTGHFAIMALTQNSLIVGFFFTPGGRK